MARVRPFVFVPGCAAASACDIGGDTTDQGRAQRLRKPFSARSPAGLELHADVFVAAHDRHGLERLCRYMARPPIPQDRLACGEDGMLVLSLKRTRRGARWRSSRVRAIVFTPQALIARLAALVPARCMNLRRSYGIFGPHHKLRPRGARLRHRPARVRRPTDKARTERMVRHVREDCFGGETLPSLDAARAHALRWHREVVSEMTHASTYRLRREHFDSEERAALLPAPTERYDVPKWSEPKRRAQPLRPGGTRAVLAFRRAGYRHAPRRAHGLGDRALLRRRDTIEPSARRNALRRRSG